MKRKTGEYVRECVRKRGGVSSVLLLVCLPVLAQGFLPCASAARGDEAQTGRAPGVFIYSDKSIGELVKEQGISCDKDSRFWVTRNGEGTCLYIWPSTLPSDPEVDPVLVVRSRSDVRKLYPPAGMLPTGAINDSGEFLLCIDMNSGEFVLANGLRRSVPKATWANRQTSGLDPGGRYYFTASDAGTEVVDVAEPNKVLARSKYHATNICATNSAIYLFVLRATGSADEDQYPKVLETYQKSGSTFELEAERRIPRPSSQDAVVSVEDFDPESGRVLLCGYVDMPLSFLSARYLYDLKTEKITRLGSCAGHGFFLKRDILEAARK